MRRTLLATAVAACFCTPALADKVIFNNGDVLTGTIETYDGSKLTLNTPAAGEVKIDLKDVKTFSTDKPITLQLKDGAVINQLAVPTTQPGTFGIDKGVVNSQTFTLTQIKAINPAPPAWVGDITLGADLQRGNTFTDEYHAGFDLNRREDDDRFTSNGLYQLGRQKDPDTGKKSTTVENWIVNAKFDHFIHDTKWYLFASAIVAKDQIQDLNLRFIPGAGVGYQWFESPKLNFNTEAGVAYIYEDYNNQATREDYAVKFAYHFDKQITDRLKLIHNFEYDPSVESGEVYLISTDIGLREEVTKQFFMEGKIVEVYNADPAAGHHKNDTQYLFSLGYKF